MIILWDVIFVRGEYFTNFKKAKKFGVSGIKFETTSRNIPRNHYKYRSRSLLKKESRSYPRDAARPATSRPPMLAAK